MPAPRSICVIFRLGKVYIRGWFGVLPGPDMDSGFPEENESLGGDRCRVQSHDFSFLIRRKEAVKILVG